MGRIHGIDEKDMFAYDIVRWTDYANLNLREDYIDNIYEIKKGMHEKTKFETIDVLEFRKAIVQDIYTEVQKEVEFNRRAVGQFKEDQGELTQGQIQHYPTELKVDIYHFSNEELVTNRMKSGMKVTKYLTKFATQFNNREYDPRVDHFIKEPSGENEYYIDNDPNAFVRLYNKIETCLSPGGENQSNFIKFLISPYVYIAYDKKESIRTVIYADYENKVVFFNPFYGRNNRWFSYSLVKHFIDLGFKIAKFSYHYFDDNDLVYKDAVENYLAAEAKELGGEFYTTSEGHDEALESVVSLFQYPDWCTFDGDALQNQLHSYEKINQRLTLMMDFSEMEMMYCESCDSEVHEDDYNFDHDMCWNCVEELRCESCGEITDYDDLYRGECSYCRGLTYCENCHETFDDTEIVDGLCPTCLEETELNEMLNEKNPMQLKLDLEMV